ncbi:MAG: threonine/serine exporter family protein [Clostridium sp.]|uniref:threonine/serine exporter family protein n=1 Tax=Clostridium sp. TaxID=1506 RepID=UPI003EE56EB0
MSYVVEIVSCVVGAFGYALMYNVKKDKIVAATIGGFFTITTYVIVSKIYNNILFSTTIASGVITVYSEILARKLKAPATVFLLPGIITLAPGGGLFYTMTGLITGNEAEFHSYGLSTLQTTAGIAIGVIIASLVFYHLNRILYRKMKKIESTKK